MSKKKKGPVRRDTREEREALQQVRRMTRVKTVPSGKRYIRIRKIDEDN